MKNHIYSKKEILKTALSPKGILSTFLFLFFCFYAVNRNTMAAVEILGKSAFATGIILIFSVIMGFIESTVTSRKGAEAQPEADSLDELSDEEYETRIKTVLTPRNTFRAAIYFYCFSLGVSIIGLQGENIWKIILVSFLLFGLLALMFFSRLLYVRIRYGTWIAPRRR